MTMYNVYQAYSVYPEKPSLIQVSTIAKIEGSLVFADSASPEILHPTDLPNPLTAAPTLVLLMPSNPAEMAKWLLSIYNVFKLYDYDSSQHYIPSSSKKSMSQPDLAALAKDQPIIKVTPPTNSNTLYLNLADIEQLPMSGETVVDTKALFDKIYQEKISNVKDKRLSSTTTNSSSSGSSASTLQPSGPNIPQRQSSRFSHLRSSVISTSGASDLSKRSSVASSGNGTDTSNTASSSTARTSFTNARGKVVQLGSSSGSDDSNSSLDESSDDDDGEESKPNREIQNGKTHSDAVAKVTDGIKDVGIKDGDAVDQKNANIGDKISANGKGKSRQNRESFISSATSASYTTDSSQAGHSSTETGTSVTTGTSEEGSTSYSESESETEDSGSDDETTDSSSGSSDGESTSASSQKQSSGVPGANPSFNPNQVDFMSGLHQQQQPVDYMSQQQQALSSGGSRSSQYDPYFNQQFLPLSGSEIPQSSPVTPVSPQFGGLLARPRQSLLSQHHQQRQQYYSQLAYEQQLARQQQEAFDPPNFIGNVAPRPRGPLLSVEPPRRPAPVPSGLISAIDAREQQKSKQRYLHTGFSTSGVAELVERGAGLGKPVTMDFEKDRERLIALEQRKMEKERMEEMKRSEDIMRVKKEQERVMKENAMWMSLGLRPPSSAVPGAGAEGFDPRRSSMYSSLGGAASTPVLPAMAMPGSMSQPAPNTATTPMGMNPMMMNGMLNPMMQQQMLQQQMMMNMNMGMMGYLVCLFLNDHLHYR
ncbi:hypothetical protein BKA69DRAFT_896189 [Paraphysoderma sedebokerense]|nr:hypothetical protein BKA69DRAFT_896189 [Paraphysoderma sedebokerense]